MKHLLSTSALIAGIAFGGAAFAQAVPPADAQTSGSLLSSILANAEDLSASLSNVSQNLNHIDGSIAVTTSRTTSGMDEIITALKGSNPGFGSYSQVNANVFGSDLPAALLAVLDPLTLELGDLSTTAIGTLQSGNMEGSFDASGLVQKVSADANGATTGAAMLAETYGGIGGTLAMQNISVNSGDINGSIGLTLADVNAKVGDMATTAIGALQSGAMQASVTGSMGGVTESTSALVTALVGGPTTP